MGVAVILSLFQKKIDEDIIVNVLFIVVIEEVSTASGFPTSSVKLENVINTDEKSTYAYTGVIIGKTGILYLQTISTFKQFHVILYYFHTAFQGET